jgi:hypothetical protein
MTFEKNIRSYDTGSEGFRLVKSMLKCYKKCVFITLLTSGISTTVSMLLPYMTKMVISYV